MGTHRRFPRAAVVGVWCRSGRLCIGTSLSRRATGISAWFALGGSHVLGVDCASLAGPALADEKSFHPGHGRRDRAAANLGSPGDAARLWSLVSAGLDGGGFDR